MYNILVSSDGLIKDYDKDFHMYDNGVSVVKNDSLVYVYSDLNSATCTVQTIDFSIVDFIGNKFMYTNGEVILNPDFVEE